MQCSASTRQWLWVKAIVSALLTGLSGIRELYLTALRSFHKNFTKEKPTTPSPFSHFLLVKKKYLKKLSLISPWPFSFILPNWSREAIFFSTMSFPFTAGSFRLRTNVAQHRIPQGFEVLQCCSLLTVPKFYNHKSYILGCFVSHPLVFTEIGRHDPEKIFTIGLT